MNDQQITIYHNPRCSKSRTTLGLLEAHTPPAGALDLEIEVIRYLDHPPDAATIKHIAKLLDWPVKALIRSDDAAFKKLRDDNEIEIESLQDDDAARLIADNPALLQRPLVVFQDQAVVGRPPENVLSLLSLNK